MVSHSAPAASRQRRVEGLIPEGRLLGLVLLVIGAIVAAGFIVPDFDRYTLLAVSVTCLTGFAMSREYGFAIPAGITGGLGTAVLLISAATFGPALTPAVLFLAMAGGFLAVWLLGLVADPVERHPWPLVPTAILGSLGSAFVAGRPDAISWIQLAIATAITIAGLGLLMRHPREG